MKYQLRMINLCIFKFNIYFIKIFHLSTHLFDHCIIIFKYKYSIKYLYYILKFKKKFSVF
jgi:hypothetical protein